MQVHNTLPLLLDCLRRWETMPGAREFEREYAAPMSAHAGDFFEGFHPYLRELNWDAYRSETLLLDPEGEELRARECIARVEALFGFKLEGEILLYGSFATMDGFARFDRGRHKVYLGVDESHGRGKYLDVLTVHELTHVARETRPSTWEGWGLDPKMPRRTYLDSVTPIEHLMSEGLSCVVSELLVPDEPGWAYAYQTEDSLQAVIQHGPLLDREIHRTLRDPDGDYGRFYSVGSHLPAIQDYAHYVWAWQWVKSLLNERGGDARALVGLCSKDLLDHALAFRLSGLAP